MREILARNRHWFLVLIWFCLLFDIFNNCLNLWWNHKSQLEPVNTSSSLRLLCWIALSATTANRTNHLNETWGKRCDILIFESSEFVIEAWKRIYDRHANDAHWFLATVDDTYIVVEHLKAFLSTLDPQYPLYVGHSSNDGLDSDTYLLSRESLRRIKHKSSCHDCLTELDIVAADTRDRTGCDRFVDVPLTELDKAKSCISSEAVSFPEVEDFQLQVYEFLIYRLKVKNANELGWYAQSNSHYVNDML